MLKIDFCKERGKNLTLIKKIVQYFKNLCYYVFRIKVHKSSLVVNMEKGEMKLTVFDVANFFRTKEVMSNKKLQKLVYYAYAWYIALNNDEKDNIQNKLCENTTFEAWVHGPVCRTLYNFMPSNYGIIDRYDGKINPTISGEIEDFLNMIYKTFGKYTGYELETMTHAESPWINARGNRAPSEPSNNLISEEDMFVYYNSL